MDVSELSELIERNLFSSDENTDSSLEKSDGGNSVLTNVLQSLNKKGIEDTDIPEEEKRLTFQIAVVECLVRNLRKTMLELGPKRQTMKRYFSLLLTAATTTELFENFLRALIELLEEVTIKFQKEGGEELFFSLETGFLFLCSVLEKKSTVDKSKPSVTEDIDSQEPGHKLSEEIKSIEPKGTDWPSGNIVKDEESDEEDYEDYDEVSDKEEVKENPDSAENSDSTSKLCTYVKSGNNYMEQHWYFCYTCNLVKDRGCCTVCAHVCHKDHQVVYSRSSRFFCDCGAGDGGESTCLALKPYETSDNSQKNLSSEMSKKETSKSQQNRFSWDSDEFGEAGISSLAGSWMDIHSTLSEDEILEVSKKVQLGERLAMICSRISSANEREEKVDETLKDIVLDKKLEITKKAEILKVRGCKAGSLEAKIKTEFSKSKELGEKLTSGALWRSAVSSSISGKLAVGEGDKVTIFDSNEFCGKIDSDRLVVKPLSRNNAKFNVVFLEFNQSNGSILAVGGYEDCQVLTLDSQGEVVDRLAVHIGLQEGEFVKKISWVPNSKVQLMIASNLCFKVFDLSLDSLSPISCVTLLEDSVQDVVLVPGISQQFVAIVLTEKGHLCFSLLSGKKGSGDFQVGCLPLTVPVDFPLGGEGHSLCFSTRLQLLIVSFKDGSCYAGRLSRDGLAIEEGCEIEVSPELGVFDDGMKLGNYCWREILPDSSVFACWKFNSLVGIELGPNGCRIYPFKPNSGSPNFPRIEGIAGVKSPIDGLCSFFVLREDGSFQVHDIENKPSNEDQIASLSKGKEELHNNIENTKKLWAVLSKQDPEPKFPLDFFESAFSITHEAKLAGDVVNTSVPETSASVFAEGVEYFESPSASGFKLMVFNPKQIWVMVGCQIHVGNSGSAYIPSTITIFKRTIKLEEGVSRWYDIPFTDGECLLAANDFTLTVGPTFDGTSLPRIDFFNFYAKSKEAFKFNEKLLEVYSEGESGKSGTLGLKFGNELEVTLGPEGSYERVLILSLMTLRLFLARSGGRASLEEKLIGEILGFVRGILSKTRKATLRSASQALLHSISSSASLYYEETDEISLSQTFHALPGILHSLRVRKVETLSAAEEFASNLKTICGIGRKRFSHFNSFLKQNGSQIVDQFLEAFWLIEESGNFRGEVADSVVGLIVQLLCDYSHYLVENSTSEGSKLDPQKQAHALEPAASHLRRLLTSESEQIRSHASLALSSRLLQVPVKKASPISLVETTGKKTSTHAEAGTEAGTDITGTLGRGDLTVTYRCDGCDVCPITNVRWHCLECEDFDLCQNCFQNGEEDERLGVHISEHEMIAFPTVTAGNSGDQTEREGRRDARGGRIEEHREEDGNDMDEDDDDDEEAEEEEEMEEREEVIEEEIEVGEDEEDEGEKFLVVRDTQGRNSEQRDNENSALQNFQDLHNMSYEDMFEMALELSRLEQGNEERNMDEETVGENSRESSGARQVDESNNNKKDSSKKKQEWDADVESDHRLLFNTKAPEKLSLVRDRAGRLLLRQLFHGADGWLQNLDGHRILPSLQLLYRMGVASCRGFGPFALPLVAEFWSSGEGNDGVSAQAEEVALIFDIEGVVKLLVNCLDLAGDKRPEERTASAECAVLIFMFLSLVLRKWRQPSSDSFYEESPNETELEVAKVEIEDGVPLLGSVERSSAWASRKLEKACVLVKIEQIVSYLFSILDALKDRFSPGSVLDHTDSVKDSYLKLLVPDFNSPPATFAPFFSNSFAKTHKGDLFVDFDQVLLETSFRLAYNIIRHDSHKIKSDERDETRTEEAVEGNESQVHLENQWKNLLCCYMTSQKVSFVRKYARQLLLHACGNNKTEYYSVRDNWQFRSEFETISGLAHRPYLEKRRLEYEQHVSIHFALTSLHKVAVLRPFNFQSFCLEFPNSLANLMDYTFGSWPEELVLCALKVILVAFLHIKSRKSMESLIKGLKDEGKPPPKKEEEGNKQSFRDVMIAHLFDLVSDGTGREKDNSEKGVSHGEGKKKPPKKRVVDEESYSKLLNMETLVSHIFGNSQDSSRLPCFINLFLLEWNSTSIRAIAKEIVEGCFNHGNTSFRESLVLILFKSITTVAVYGKKADKLAEILTWLLRKVVSANQSQTPESGENSSLVSLILTDEFLLEIFQVLKSQNELLANHPNSKLYNSLRNIVEFEGYYLESEPCLSCSCPEVPFSRMRMDNIKQETKYTDTRILLKCNSSYVVQSLTMAISDASKSRSVRTVNFYYNNRPVNDLAELKYEWSKWQKVGSWALDQNQTELKASFTVPLVLCNFMVEFSTFYDDIQAASLETLRCPRCSRSVAERHGMCSNCLENANQCRQCHSINHDKPDAFLCVECGASRYGWFDFSFSARPNFNFEPMESDDDMKRGLSAIETEAANAHRKYMQLQGFKAPLLKLISSLGDQDSRSLQLHSGIPGVSSEVIQQALGSLPGSSSIKINRKIVVVGLMYNDKCRSAFDSVSKSVQTLIGLRKTLVAYKENKRLEMYGISRRGSIGGNPSKPSNQCYGCAITTVGTILEWLQALVKLPRCKDSLVNMGMVRELSGTNIHHGPRHVRESARTVLVMFTRDDSKATSELNDLILKKVSYCLEHHRSLDVSSAIQGEMQLLTDCSSIIDSCWEVRLRSVFNLLFQAVSLAAKNPIVVEQVILPCLRIISKASKPTSAPSVPSILPPSRPPPPPPSFAQEKEDNGPEYSRSYSHDWVNFQRDGRISVSERGAIERGGAVEYKSSSEGPRNLSSPLMTYSEWTKGASIQDFARRSKKFGKESKENKSELLALKCFLKWRQNTCVSRMKQEASGEKAESIQGILLKGDWLKDLILSACSESIREEVSSLILNLSQIRSSVRSHFIEVLYFLLPHASKAGESASDYFSLLGKLVQPEEWRCFLAVKGFLKRVCDLLWEESKRIESLESSLQADISQGYSMLRLSELLIKFMEVSTIKKKFSKDKLLPKVLKSCLTLKGLLVQKTKITEDCRKNLSKLLNDLVEKENEMKKEYLKACIDCLQVQIEESLTSPLHILEEISRIICPETPEPDYLLYISRPHSQDLFYRSELTKNPYSSKELGTTMKDVKSMICQELEFSEDCPMELLVAGSIINLELPISSVFESVWRQSLVPRPGLPPPPVHECPPMSTLYRLQGVDGEAQEPMIDEIEEVQKDSVDPEVEFAIAGVLEESYGLEPLLKMLKGVRESHLQTGLEEVSVLLKVILYSCKVKKNRVALLLMGALPVVLECASLAFSLSATSAPEKGETAEDYLEVLLSIVESLVEEANLGELGADFEGADSKVKVGLQKGQGLRAVSLFLEKLAAARQGGETSGVVKVFQRKKKQKGGKSSETVAKILPFLAFGEEEAMAEIIHHFEPFDWLEFDEIQVKASADPQDKKIVVSAKESKMRMADFVVMCDSIKNDPNGKRFKALILQKGIPQGGMKHLLKVFPPATVMSGPDYKNLLGVSTSLELPSVPIILSILTGLSKGNVDIQICISEHEFLPLLHCLEVSGKLLVGAKAEMLMDLLGGLGVDSEKSFLKVTVSTIRKITKDEMKNRALRKRDQLLQGLGMTKHVDSSGGEKVMLSDPLKFDFGSEPEEESPIFCMVCKEGYTLKPGELLGAYSFIKRFNLALDFPSTMGRTDWGYSTVTHFNIIHFSCHEAAKQADLNLKTPKREWDGASLRNSGTFCNSLFPLKGPLVSLQNYVSGCESWWNQGSSVGRADGTRSRIVLHDIVTLIGRLASGASFSVDSHGGGVSSNIKILPFQFQMAAMLLDQFPQHKNSGEKNLQEFLKAELSFPSDFSAQTIMEREKSIISAESKRYRAPDESLQYLGVLSVLLLPYSEWETHRRRFLSLLLRHAFVHFREGHLGKGVLYRGLATSIQSESDESSEQRRTRKLDNSSQEMTEEMWLSALHPAIMFIGLLNQCHKAFKEQSASGFEVDWYKEGLWPKREGLMPWELSMRKQMVNVDAMHAFSNSLLQWLEDAQSATSLLEAFDTAELLGDALSETSECLDFVKKSIGL